MGTTSLCCTQTLERSSHSALLGGNFRPKRLIFGAKTSQHLFDDMMFRIFGDISMCLNQRDDILIGGRNIDKHNVTLQMVFQRAQDFGVTFSLAKCQFGVEDIDSPKMG